MNKRERRRFTTGKYNRDQGGYPVNDRSVTIAWFVYQNMAIQYCRTLRATPQLANSCDACCAHIRPDEIGD